MKWKQQKRKRNHQEAGQAKKKPRIEWSTYLSWKQVLKLNPLRSVGVRLFLIFMVSILLVVFGLGTLSYQTAKSTIKETASVANQEAVQQVGEKLDLIMERYVDMSTQIFFDSNIQDYLETLLGTGMTDFERFEATSALNEQLMNMQFTNQSVASITIIHKRDDVPIISTGAASTMSAAREEEWFGELLESGGIKWLPSNAAQSGDNTFRMARVMKNVDASIGTYVIVIEIDTSTIEDELKAVNLGENSVLQAITGEGVVAASTIPERTGQETELAFFKEITEESGVKDTTNTMNDQHEEVLAVYNTLDVSRWRIVGMIPVNELVKDAQSILVTTIIVAGAAFIIAILIGFWMVRMIAKPLVNLKELMAEGAKGNLAVRTSHKSKDEIGMLSDNFNIMMEQITALVNQTNQTAQDVLVTATELSTASQKTAASAAEVAIATEQIAGGATNLASEAERGSEMTDLISSQMQKVVGTNEELGQSAKLVEGASQEGTKYLNGLLGKTEQSEQMIRALVTKVDTLKGSTSSILSILDVLQNIARQTNILSLNATIEAARAGAAGRGFMVVADEVRQLADQSKESINMVADMTDRIMNEMNETVSALSEAYPLFQEQIEAVKETGEIFQTVEEQMGMFVNKLTETSASIDALSQSQVTLSETMMSVSSVAEQSSATSQEVASLSSEQQSVGNQLVELSNKMEKVSEELKATLSAFRL
ncbi:methyl-accepting chemotaxis protein [Neobacillus mesonae]|nr:methyl-accepting chemotaxis protein [Neobacillus mesonae]